MSLFSTTFDVIVIGGGHAGSEAAAASANMGAHTLLITMNLQNIAQMSCNPAMGGIAKGQIVREIDALGGYSGVVTDKTAIQFKMLNKSKGPAMWSPRAQCDRKVFEKEWRKGLEGNKNIDFWQDTVDNITTKNGAVTGVITKMGVEISAKSVVLCNGTFLNGLIHLGKKNYKGGRSGEPSAEGIKKQFEYNSGMPERIPPVEMIMVVAPAFNAVSVASRASSVFPLCEVERISHDGFHHDGRT